MPKSKFTRVYVFQGGSYYYPILVTGDLRYSLFAQRQKLHLDCRDHFPAIDRQHCVYFYGNVPRQRYKQVPDRVSTIINPGGSIKKLEQQLKFSDTFNNRVALADAYLSNGDTDKAIDMYKSCLTGTFTDNEYVIYQLILAYSALNDYGQIVPLARKGIPAAWFARSKSAYCLCNCAGIHRESGTGGRRVQKMKARFSYFEARYQYGLFSFAT